MLVVVLMLGVIAIFAVTVSRSVSGAAKELSAARHNLEAQSDLRAGIEVGVAAILKLGDDVRDADAQTELRGRRIVVRATNERARIDINVASPALIAGLLRANGLDKDQAASLAASVVEWRGGVKSRALQSALDSDSSDESGLGLISGRAATPTTQKPTAPSAGIRFLFHPSQLTAVSGFSPALVKAVLPSLTVANGANQINPFIAEPDVLKALPESTDGKVESFLNARDGNVGRATALQLLGVDKKLLTEGASRGWRLRITTFRRDAPLHSSEAVVVLAKDVARAYRVLYVDYEV